MPKLDSMLLCNNIVWSFVSRADGKSRMTIVIVIRTNEIDECHIYLNVEPQALATLHSAVIQSQELPSQKLF